MSEKKKRYSLHIDKQDSQIFKNLKKMVGITYNVTNQLLRNLVLSDAHIPPERQQIFHKVALI